MTRSIRLFAVMLASGSLGGCYACPDIGLGTPIHLTLLDTTSGSPVPDATVRCVRDLRDFSDTATAHPNGAYACGYWPGTYDVTVTWHGRMLAQRVVDVPASPQDHDRCVFPPPVVALTLHVDAPPSAADAGTGDAGP